MCIHTNNAIICIKKKYRVNLTPWLLNPLRTIRCKFFCSPIALKNNFNKTEYILPTTYNVIIL